MAVYLDHNATTPVDGAVVEAMLPYLGGEFGNPSSAHARGRRARAAVEAAREQVADLVGAHPSQVLFTGGGTEANNTALRGATARLTPGRLLISAVEHPSVKAPAAALRGGGWRVETLPVDGMGRLTAETVAAALDAETRLVSVMTANNETGVVYDIAVLGAPVREAGALLHTDAVQAVGKIPVDFGASGAHLMSLSAHKIHGPKGVGALVVDKALDLEPLLYGGGQERDRRGGTENLAGIVGFGAAAELAAARLDERHRLSALRQRLEAALLEAVPRVRIFAEQALRLPNTVFFALPGVDGPTLVLELDRHGFELSSGAACGSGRTDPSPVLTAMGIESELGRGAVRVSLGRESTPAEVDALVGVLRREAERFRTMAAVAWA